MCGSIYILILPAGDVYWHGTPEETLLHSQMPVTLMLLLNYYYNPPTSTLSLVPPQLSHCKGDYTVPICME
uniref:Uncharacterized protein n=1 Tax=Pyxicephalus adspersus TaxID=30357 RepID=A0AAV2ZI56_PYXAD|nr:TPA: hypothetical protein GDO54_004720 [Pyxicephalus adspersus]